MKPRSRAPPLLPERLLKNGAIKQKNDNDLSRCVKKFAAASSSVRFCQCKNFIIVFFQSVAVDTLSAESSCSKWKCCQKMKGRTIEAAGGEKKVRGGVLLKFKFKVCEEK